MAKSPWTTISVKPTGQLDTRSQVADLPPGFLRWKLNFGCSDVGQCRRLAGFERFSTGNADHHHQGASREVITFGLETTDNAGVRRLFDGTNSRVSALDESSNTWTDIITGVGGDNARWTAGVSQGSLILANGVDADAIYEHVLGSGVATPIAELAASGITGARVVVEFEGFIVIMNFVDGGTRLSSRVKWSDLNLPASWDIGGGSLANFQDLDYGDEILAAAYMLGALYIYTRRAIWRMSVSSSNTKVFTFERRYYEPENQTGCLVYPGTLVSTGAIHYYASRDSIYEYSPYVAAPQRPDEGEGRSDWLHKATGVIFTDPQYKLSGENCNIPVAEYLPATKELWISWTPGAGLLNSLTLAANIPFKQATVVDTGFTAFVNFRQNPAPGSCNERQEFLGASSRDWALKTIGEVFVREFYDLEVLTADIPLDAEPVTEGYNSVMRGVIPLGFYDREKIVNNVLLEQDCADQDVPCVAALRIGNSRKLEDPNSTDARRAPLWRNIRPNVSLASLNVNTLAAMRAKNLRPSTPHEWSPYEQGIYLYWEFTIQNSNGTPAIGAQSVWTRIDFNASALPK